MMVVAASTGPLPAELAITERSRKFYDGTYQWDLDGFTDELGVYRECDCMDPLAHAPTPLPPMLLFNDEDDENDDENDNSQLGLSSSSAAALSVSAAAEPDMSLPHLNSSHCTAFTTDVPRTPGSIRRFVINLFDKPKHSKVASQEQCDVESHITEIEVPPRSYEHREAPKPAKRGSSSMKMPDAPPASPAEMLSVIQDMNSALTTSTPSPVSSILSDYGNEGMKVVVP
ncbi:hypothetical protein N0V91_000357 [Didymella pomorum]|uniref:Uncharacterized protein n=1 Tax=Didymella pomorum TaxID=749634 RepID=A0A9W8ZMD6_9PLEO|nr:hypothetical protein N0V91_000357 [Didymella pomorum]